MKRKGNPIMSSSQVYPVEAVRAKRYNTILKRDEYLVKWQGWKEKDNTWEPQENLAGCDNIIMKFHNRNKIKDQQLSAETTEQFSFEVPQSSVVVKEKWSKGIQYFIQLLQKQKNKKVLNQSNESKGVFLDNMSKIGFVKFEQDQCLNENELIQQLQLSQKYAQNNVSSKIVQTLSPTYDGNNEKNFQNISEKLIFQATQKQNNKQDKENSFEIVEVKMINQTIYYCIVQLRTGKQIILNKQQIIQMDVSLLLRFYENNIH